MISWPRSSILRQIVDPARAKLPWLHTASRSYQVIDQRWIGACFYGILRQNFCRAQGLPGLPVGGVKGSCSSGPDYVNWEL